MFKKTEACFLIKMEASFLLKKQGLSLPGVPSRKLRVLMQFVCSRIASIVAIGVPTCFNGHKKQTTECRHVQARDGKRRCGTTVG